MESAFLPSGTVKEGLGEEEEEGEGKNGRKRGAKWLDNVAEDMKEADEEDRASYKQLLKEKRLKRRKLEVFSPFFCGW